MLYRIKSPDIKRLALVKTPASGHRWHLLKSAPAQEGEIIRPASPDWKIAYTVVAEPGHVEGGGITPSGEVAKGADGRPAIDVWDAEAIRQAAHSFARNGGMTTDQHFGAGQTLGRWAESYIAPVDHTIEGKPVKAGSWVLGIEPTSEGREAIESGEVGGVSVEGDATREPVLKTEPAADDGCGCEDELLEEIAVAVTKQALLKAVLAKALSTKQRKKLPASAFALSGGRYPIDTRARAANALSRATQNATPAEQAKIKRAVCRRYPDLPACKS